VGKYIRFWQAVSDSNLVAHWNCCNLISHFYFITIYFYSIYWLHYI